MVVQDKFITPAVIIIALVEGKNERICKTDSKTRKVLKEAVAQERFAMDTISNSRRHRNDGYIWKTDSSMRQVCKEVLTHDRFVVKAGLILALEEKTELIDACANR